MNEVIHTAITDNRYFLPSVLAIILIAILFPENLVFLSAAIVIVLLTIIYKKNFLVGLSVVLFLILTGDIQPGFRIMINGFGFLIFLYFGIIENKVVKLIKIHPLLMLLIIVTLISMFFSAAFSNDPSIALYMLFQQFIFFTLCYFIYAWINKSRQIYLLLYSIVLATLILSISILVDFLRSGNYLLSSFMAFNRFGGVIYNLNAAGGLFAIGFPILISIPLLKPLDTFYKKCLFAILVVIASIALLLTGSRSSIIVVFISSLYLTFKLNKKLFRIFSYTTIIISALFIVVPQLNNLLVLFARVERITANREIYWQLAYNIFQNNIILGVGPGLFEQNAYRFLPFSFGSWAEYQVSGLFSQQAGIGHAHNFLLFRASELGVGGIITTLLLPITYFYFVIKSKRLSKDKNPQIYKLTIILNSIGIGVFLRSFYESIGIMTHGWISRDLPFWIAFLIIAFLYQQIKYCDTEGIKI